VGSHVLETLNERKLPVAVLLRPTSSRRFLDPLLPQVELREGSILKPESLRDAMKGITHVIHCAGCVKAVRTAEFYEVNQHGTRNLVAAVNSAPGVRQFIHVSSLATAGPSLPHRPKREDDAAQPVSDYGGSKLAGEQEVKGLQAAHFVILRPPAV